MKIKITKNNCQPTETIELNPTENTEERHKIKQDLLSQRFAINNNKKSTFYDWKDIQKIEIEW